jgi:hypothetical protein
VNPFGVKPNGALASRSEAKQATKILTTTVDVTSSRVYFFSPSVGVPRGARGAPKPIGPGQGPRAPQCAPGTCCSHSRAAHPLPHALEQRNAVLLGLRAQHKCPPASWISGDCGSGMGRTITAHKTPVNHAGSEAHEVSADTGGEPASASQIGPVAFVSHFVTHKAKGPLCLTRRTAHNLFLFVPPTPPLLQLDTRVRRVCVCVTPRISAVFCAPVALCGVCCGCGGPVSTGLLQQPLASLSFAASTKNRQLLLGGASVVRYFLRW